LRPDACKPSPAGVLGRPRATSTRIPCVLAQLGFRRRAAIPPPIGSRSA